MAASDLALEVSNLHKSYGAFVAIQNVSFQASRGELVALLGPSGCGKTTILRIIAGLVRPDGGQVIIGGRDIIDVPAYRRNLGLVFQNYALFPHMSVQENVAYGLKARGVSKNEIGHRVQEALKLVRLSELEDRRPHQLSGGQQQRVALSRALVINPEILLLDEPLSNLDAKVRTSVGSQIRELQKTLGITTILVTHDQAEALSLADRVVLMHAGYIERIGTPEEVYRDPQSPFVADFLGLSNMCKGILEHLNDTYDVCVTEHGLKVRIEPHTEPSNTEVLLAVRAENIRLSTATVANAEAVNTFPGIVEERFFLGDTTKYLISLECGWQIWAIPKGQAKFSRGERPIVTWDSKDTVIIRMR